MANETRVNLKHLLEDLRDAYASPLEEVIVTELIANALDSGATQIRLEASPAERLFRCIDNGEGMNRAALRSYHNIATSTKERGAGIGFAGVGAKLALLVAERVVTESRGKHGAQGAAQWHLQNAFRAPWKFIPFSGLIEQGKGTAVTLILKDDASLLVDGSFLARTIQRHFYPLLSANETIRKVLKGVYKKSIKLTVVGNDVAVEVPGDTRSFFVHLGKSRRPVGAGFIERANLDENFWSRLFGRETVRPTDTGLRISTYGKVIRGGWEWLGVEVKHPELLSGVVEVPTLSEILTTNKSDFLSTPQALKKYYEIRKAIQHSVIPVLRELGELEEKKSDQKTPSAYKPLTQDIEGALCLMADAFPELEALVGEHWRHRKALETSGKKKTKRKERMPSVESSAQILSTGNVGTPRERTDLETDPVGNRTKRERSPGLQIAFEPFEQVERQRLAKLLEDKVVINTRHPSWTRAQALAQEPYHVLLAVALTLAEEMQPADGVPAFVSAFLKAWSEASEKSGKLL
ncbi:MAG: ATP-binding protein [Patescibacteria group bacterium]